MSKERVPYLDIVRVLACLMVITMHAPKPGIGTSSIVLSSISFLMAPCIGLFFMTSGALLLPTRLPMFVFYKKRIGKVLVPTIIWSCFYLGLQVLKGNITIIESFKAIISIPFSAQGHGILWFMYTLTGLYLITPIISPWLERATKKEIEFILLLWVVTLCYPLIKSFVAVKETPDGILYSFSGYAGYYLLGYYLHKYRLRIPIIGLIILFFVPIGIAAYYKLKSIPVDFFSVFWYLSILVVMMAVSLFVAIQQVCDRTGIKSPRGLILASNLSFGIYLSHIFFMRDIVWKISVFDKWGGLYQILITVILTYIFSFFFSLLVSFSKCGSYITGYRIRQ